MKRDWTGRIVFFGGAAFVLAQITRFASRHGIEPLTAGIAVAIILLSLGLVIAEYRDISNEDVGVKQCLTFAIPLSLAAWSVIILVVLSMGGQ